MNQTVKGAITKVDSAFSFVKEQVETFNQEKRFKQRKFKTMVRNGLALSTTVVLTLITAFPMITQSAPENAEAIVEPNYDTSIAFDKSKSLLTIEEQKIEVKIGKSLAQEEAEKQARARAQATARTRTVASATGPAITVTRVSAEEAHRLARDAAAKAGIPGYWKELAAIWQVETGKSLNSCIVSRADGRATGPMQFMPSTFRAYAADGDGDGRADICNAKDALVAAGKLLKRNGIENNVDGAIHSYNHSMAYVQKVRRIASGIN